MFSVLTNFLYNVWGLWASILFSFIKLVILFLILTIVVATVTLIERKILSLTQRRVGPNYIGYKGRMQFMADALKLLLKHILILSKANKLYFILVPALVCMIIYLFWANILWGPNLAICEVEYNVFLMCLISNLCSILLVIAGYSSNNKYAILSSSRVLITGLVLEILLTFLLLVLALASQSINFYLIAQTQSNWDWNIFVCLPIWPIMVVTFFLETSRIPFDFTEAEAELIAGYTTEYGGFYFALFYLGEYFHLYCFSAIYTVCLFGGYF